MSLWNFLGGFALFKCGCDLVAINADGNEESMNSITVDDVKNFMKNLNGQGNYRVVILDPETK